MGARLLVIDEIAGQDAAQVSVAENKNVIRHSRRAGLRDIPECPE
jgi:hypothetical protein